MSQIFNGGSLSSPSLGRFCGAQPPPALPLSSSNRLTFSFISNTDSVRSTGFRLNYTEVPAAFLPESRLLVAQAIPPILSHFSAAWSVCLSSICHIRAFCLNRSTNFHAIRQIRVHLWRPRTHFVRWRSPSPRGIRSDLGSNARLICCCLLLTNRMIYDSTVCGPAIISRSMCIELLWFMLKNMTRKGLYVCFLHMLCCSFCSDAEVRCS